jgi:beta-galactosidase
MKRIQLACAGMMFAALALTPVVEPQVSAWPDLVFPFGAVHFRKSNPPEQDWDRDHKTAAQMGVNVFRHWFM